MEVLAQFTSEQLKKELSRRSYDGKLLADYERQISGLLKEQQALAEKIAKIMREYEKLKERRDKDLEHRSGNERIQNEDSRHFFSTVRPQCRHRSLASMDV